MLDAPVCVCTAGDPGARIRRPTRSAFYNRRPPSQKNKYTMEATDVGSACTDEGLAPRKIVEFAPDGKLVGKFFFVADPDGYEIEVLQRGGRFK